MRRIFPLAVMLLAVLTPFARAAPLRTAFLPFILKDTSLPSPQSKPGPADLHRLELVDQVVEQGLVRSGEYIPLDLKPIAAQIAENDLVGCPDCAVSLARQVGAQVVVTGWVQKVSGLIINMTIIIRSVDTGKMIAAGDVSLRGDTDIAWTRAASWLVAHRLLPPGSK
ncbi:MAG TPA: DUF3280 domain-containing protein [Acetobacteraceae bacterium]|nr:DUF3280 domain-containing protein [Acetobacteraceae bacterium]